MMVSSFYPLSPAQAGVSCGKQSLIPNQIPAFAGMSGGF